MSDRSIRRALWVWWFFLVGVAGAWFAVAVRSSPFDLSSFVVGCFILLNILPRCPWNLPHNTTEGDA